MIQQILGIIFPVFAIVLFGFVYARWHGPDMAAANTLNLHVFTPALLFAVLSGNEFNLGSYGGLALAGAIVILGSGLLVWPISRLLGYQARTLVPPVMFNNSGNMGLPLALFAFGEKALPAAVVLFMVENVLHFTVGQRMLTGHVHVLQLLRMPMLLAAIAGIAFSAFSLPVYAPLHEAIELLGQVAIPLMLFSLGVRMTGIDSADWKIGVTGAVLAPLAGLAIAWPLIPVMGIDGLQARQLLLFAVLPPAVLNFMLAEQFRQEPKKVAAIVLFGNLASLVSVPLVLMFVL